MTTTTIEAPVSPAPKMAKAKKKATPKKKAAKAKAKQAPSSPPSGAPANSPPPPKVVEAEGFRSLLLHDVAPATGLAKIGFVGGGKAGKSRGATEAAIAVHRAIKSTRPVVVVDTEVAAAAIVARLAAAGIRAKVMPSRSLADLTRLLDEVAGIADVMIIDSVTHIWEHLVDGYKREQGIDKLGPADWVALNSKWHTHFSLPFVRSSTHIIFTARAGYEYDTVYDQAGRSEQVRGDMKMRAEGQLAHEPTIVFEMTRVDVVVDGEARTVRRATALDRLDVIDGVSFDNISADDLADYVAATLAAGSIVAPFEESSVSDLFASSGNDRRERYLVINECKSALNQAWSALTANGKACRIAALVGAFGTSSWEVIETMGLDKLRLGQRLLRRAIADGHVITSIPSMPAETVLANMREGLAEADDDADADRRLIAAQTMASTLPHQNRSEADALIADASRRFTGSGGVRSSGGTRLSAYEAAR